MTAAIRNGTPAARHTAAVTRSRTAFAQPRPARTSAANIAIARRVTHAATARKVLSPRCSHIYSPAWWGSRGNLYSRRWYYYNSNPWWYWWGWATWNQVDSWVDNDWDGAWDYEYDDNVVFDDDSVYINDEPVASAEDYIAMGEDLADIGEPGETDKIDWLPLGVFAMSASEEDQDPQMTVQLVLAKDGRVGGTYFHARTESTREIKGSLNRETQRIAFKIGDETDNVIEVGLDSLTRDQAPIWVHFDHGSRTQTWTLIRLPPPPEAEAAKNDAQ